MFSDLAIIWQWWMVWLGMGIISLPVMWRWMGKSWDRGYGFSKLITWLVVGYVVWLVASLHLVKFSIGLIGVAGAIWVGVNYWVVWRSGGEFFEVAKKEVRRWVGLELVFLTSLIAWSWVRGFQPDIEGLEKFMDYGFVNSILRSEYFPPKDMWFAGGSINYYYFGHYLSALVTKISGVKPAVAYNLMIATLFSLIVSMGVSLGANLLASAELKLSRLYPVLAGGLVAFLIGIRGNLHSFIYMILEGGEKYWYPDATRYIPFTIHEFPMYSFVVADLHAHLIDVPVVLGFLMVWVMIVRQGWIKLREVGVLGGLLGIMAMANAWDWAIYLLVSGVTLLLLAMRKWGKLGVAVWESFKAGVGLLAISWTVSLPFQLNFEQIAEGVRWVEARSPVYQLLVLWGWDLFLLAGFGIFLFGVWSEWRSGWLKKAKRAVKYAKGKVKHKRWLPMIEWLKEMKTVDQWVVLLWLVGFLLIVIPEIIYVKDIYIQDYHRANTMFKLVYQSWIMFGVAGGYALARMEGGLWWGKVRRLKIFWLVLAIFGLVAVGIYPRFAVNSYYGGLRAYRGLDGEKWLATRYADDYAGLMWLRENVEGQPVVLEATGDSYTHYNRISAYSGLPTVEGWLVHEWLWRGGFDEPGKRGGEVDRMYNSVSADEARGLMEKYSVEYVFLGQLEKEKYPNLNSDKFNQLGRVVFESGGTRVWRVDG
jgi:YYY domain-containing protein